MKRTKTTIFIILILAFTAVPLTLFSFVTAEPIIVIPDYEPMDIGPEIRNVIEYVPAPPPALQESQLKTSSLEDYQYEVGDYQLWLAYGWGYGYYWDLFQLRAMNEVAEVWVADDLSFPEDDPRDPVVVTDDQADYILDEFTWNIIPTDEGYFGEPDDLYGFDVWGYGDYIDDDAKKVILVENIIDTSYFNYEYHAYVVGYFSPTIEYYLDRNIISIDAYDFVHRLGPEGYEWIPGEFVTRPNLYESTIAHEYQHLIHSDLVVDSEIWMNEACSLFAEPLCGYELDVGQIEWFMATPDNSLTKWGDQNDDNILADYGASLLWSLYITSHYGPNIMGDYVKNHVAGVEGLNALFPDGVNFNDVFHDWRIANFINADNGIYSYSSFGFNLDDLETPLNVQNVEGKTIPWTSAAVEFGETMGGDWNDPDYPTGMFEVGPYGTEYIQFSDLRGLYKFKFDGVDIAPFGWMYDNDNSLWYSGAADLYNAVLVSDPIPVNDGDFLTIHTNWDIEDNLPTSIEGWDYGFIQVSDDDGETWTSLEDEDGWTAKPAVPQVHPDIDENLPGITGSSGGWVYLNFDLSAYAGMSVLIAFRYMTDWYTTYEGWLIDEAKVEGTDLVLTPVYPEADFMVSIVSKYKIFGHTFYSVREMNLNDLTEYGMTLMLDTKWKEVTIVVSPIQEEGFVDYSFKVSRLFGRHRRW